MVSSFYLSADRLVLLRKNAPQAAGRGPYREATAPGPGQICEEVPKNMRVKVTLRCNECKQRNYNTVKNKKNTPDRLELNKYCPFCRKHTVHSETK